jgi:hypothetical protein
MSVAADVEAVITASDPAGVVKLPFQTVQVIVFAPSPGVIE